LKVRKHLLTKSFSGDPLTVHENRVFRAFDDNDPQYEAVHQTLREMRAFNLEDDTAKLAATLVQIYGGNGA
jgi:hypothetical protein